MNYSPFEMNYSHFELNYSHFELEKVSLTFLNEPELILVRHTVKRFLLFLSKINSSINY